MRPCASHSLTNSFREWPIVLPEPRMHLDEQLEALTREGDRAARAPQRVELPALDVQLDDIRSDVAFLAEVVDGSRGRVNAIAARRQIGRAQPAEALRVENREPDAAGTIGDR